MREYVMTTEPIRLCAIHAAPHRECVVLENGKNAAAVTLTQMRV